MFEENPMNQSFGDGMLSNGRGFSLVELLVVMVIFGVLSTVILDLYVNVQRSTVSSEEVVEVQQGMRIALEQVDRDIQMAGFLVPTTPITVAQNNLITMETASAFNAFARIPNSVTFPANDDPLLIPVSNTAMPDLFRIDNYVRIINSVDGCQPTAAGCGARDGTAPLFQISANPAASSLTLKPLSALAAPVTVQDESMIVRVPSPTEDPTFPNVVTYMLEADPDAAAPMMVLSRIWRVGLSTNEKIIATNITALRFEYLLDDGTVQPPPAAAPGTALTTAERDRIVAVRIFLTGLTEGAKTGGGKTRELQTMVKIRNI